MAEGAWQRTAWKASVDETGGSGTVLVPDKTTAAEGSWVPEIYGNGLTKLHGEVAR